MNRLLWHLPAVLHGWFRRLTGLVLVLETDDVTGATVRFYWTRAKGA